MHLNSFQVQTIYTVAFVSLKHHRLCQLTLLMSTLQKLVPQSWDCQPDFPNLCNPFSSQHQRVSFIYNTFLPSSVYYKPNMGNEV